MFLNFGKWENLTISLGWSFGRIEYKERGTRDEGPFQTQSLFVFCYPLIYYASSIEDKNVQDTLLSKQKIYEALMKVELTVT